MSVVRVMGGLCTFIGTEVLVFVMITLFVVMFFAWVLVLVLAVALE